jgi:regulator of sigma E protease
MRVVSITLALIAVSALHALGRWLVARATGLSVPLVSLGIGPRLVERKLASGTTLRLAAVPIVVWLRVRGMAPDSASEPPETPPLATP